MLFLGLDVGTSACKALLVDADGHRQAFARVAYKADASSARLPPGHAEADPEAWWRAARCAIAECLGESPAAPTAIGLTGATLVPILIDRDGRPLRPAMRWDDARAVREVEELREQ